MTASPAPTGARGGASPTAIVVVLVVLVAGILAGPTVIGLLAPRSVPAGGDEPPEHTVTVTGAGRVTVVPDLATIRLGVAIERPTATEARSAAATAMTAVVDAVRGLGVDERDIATAQVSLGPVYDWTDENRPRIRGWELTIVVVVKVRDLERLATVVDRGIAAGATTVDGIQFEVADRTPAERDARSAAIADAKAKAEVLATGLGLRIAGVASVSESVSTPVWYRDAQGFGPDTGGGDETPILPGSTEVVITVSVVFVTD